MNFSAETARRKWPIAAPARGSAPMVTVAVALAAEHAVGRIVLEAPYTSTVDVRAGSGNLHRTISGVSA